MIEKLSEYKITKRNGAYINADNNVRVMNTLVVKINELVDAVNTIQKEREAEWFEIKEWIGILEAVRKSVNIHEKQIDELQMKLEPEKCETRAENVQPDTKSRPVNVQDRMIGCTTLDIPESYKTDPFAEQRRWIGCVCRFWYDNPDDTVLDYLGKIQTGENGIEYYGKETYDWFPHCEPVKPDDDIIYQGE